MDFKVVLTNGNTSVFKDCCILIQYNGDLDINDASLHANMAPIFVARGGEWVSILAIESSVVDEK
jgi:hypothetical protein